MVVVDYTVVAVDYTMVLVYSTTIMVKVSFLSLLFSFHKVCIQSYFLDKIIISAILFFMTN